MNENNGRPAQNLDDLIDQDISSYEYFQSLSENAKRELRNYDPTTFEEMMAFVATMRGNNGAAF